MAQKIPSDKSPLSDNCLLHLTKEAKIQFNIYEIDFHFHLGMIIAFNLN